jgi:hypothetical protein
MSTEAWAIQLSYGQHMAWIDDGIPFATLEKAQAALSLRKKQVYRVWRKYRIVKRFIIETVVLEPA